MDVHIMIVVLKKHFLDNGNFTLHMDRVFSVVWDQLSYS